MSASLVGSEMCIRDSGVALSDKVPDAVEASKLFEDAEPGARHGRRTSPVSYTHLTLPTICSV
eukprot:6034145-Alexandrium_andersonii.AAC.1